MKVSIHVKVVRFPLRISPKRALLFYFEEREKHGLLMVMAADWRLDPICGEEHWLEGLTEDEFQDEDFLETFSEARLELWVR